jgi:hypothetical protein
MVALSSSFFFTTLIFSPDLVLIRDQLLSVLLASRDTVCLVSALLCFRLQSDVEN